MPLGKPNNRVCILGAGIAASLVFGGGVQAQLCFDVFNSNSDPLLQCADTDYFLAPVDGGFANAEEFVGSNTGLSSANFNGADLFNDPGDTRPPNLLDPFFSSVDLQTTQDGMGTTSFTTNHRGSVNMGPRDSLFQSAAYQTRSRITFQPINTDNPGGPTTIVFNLDYTLTLADPLDNAGLGAALGGLGIQFLGGNDDPFDEPLFDVSALVELDLDLGDGDDEPEFFGFDDPELDDAIIEIDFEPAEPEIDDVFDIDISIDLEIDIDTDFDLEPDEPIILELDTFGSIFSDGFESGDVSAWTASSPNTFTFTIASPDPNVRFLLTIPEPSGSMLMLLAGAVLVGRRPR